MTAELRQTALTLQRPWGWAILHAGKNVENRTWATKYRGRLLIHQGKTIDPLAQYFPPLRDAMREAAFQVDERMLAAGFILGWVTLRGCHQQRPGCCPSVWGALDQWHWELSEPHVLDAPVAHKGALGLWRPDHTLIDSRSGQ